MTIEWLKKYYELKNIDEDFYDKGDTTLKVMLIH